MAGKGGTRQDEAEVGCIGDRIGWRLAGQGGSWHLPDAADDRAHALLRSMDTVKLTPWESVIFGALKGTHLARGVSTITGFCQVDDLVSWYRGTSLVQNSAPLGPYSRTMPRVPGWP